MVSFPISLALTPYAVFLVIIAFFVFMNLRNLVRYRAEDSVAFAAMFIFLAGLATLAFFSWRYMAPINWKEIVQINLFQNGFSL